MSSGDQDYKYDSTTEDSNFLNPLSDGWDRHPSSHRMFESKEQPEYGEWTKASLANKCVYKTGVHNKGRMFVHSDREPKGKEQSGRNQTQQKGK